jgi:DNA helicase-2/ATP-dependent DNA helicase PcrA
MDHWEQIRSQARTQHARMCAAASGETSAQALLEAAAHSTGIQAEPVHAGDPLLDGGEAVLDREFHVIWFNADIEPELARFYIAHEYAHYWLHDASAICGQTDVDPLASEASVPTSAQLVEGYSPEERREREANVYAREFLLPTDLLRQWYLSEGLRANEIASRVGVIETIVLHQLARLLLVPALSDGDHAESVDPLPLDSSQQEAAHAERGPLLIEAGPGTGKTRTLIGRISFLLAKGVNPSSILALTFSNKATEEMRTRIGQVAPEAAQRLWMGTFHAFGLELLRKFGASLGLSPRPRILEPIDAFFVLERLLPSLQLDYYQDYSEPTRFLRDLLDAISRAKDELVGPADYLALAQQMLENATNEKEQEAAEKALEVARVYACYQEYLEQHHLLDFGDLIFRSVLLLRAHPGIRASIRQTYSHVLVDEYQDVNRASGLLLCEIAGSGEGLWVVGDVRQAIYRFRGAAPGNMRLFIHDFPGAQVRSLRRNYRSQPAIVGVFTELASRMQTTVAGGTAFTPWVVERPNAVGNVVQLVAEDAAAEGAAVAQEVARRRGEGIPYRDQAVLCRSHAALARIAAHLEAAGVPVLYLGNLFERAEIRDLLALLSLASGDERGLVRVARFTEYQIPLADVQALLALAREHLLPFLRALTLAGEVPFLTEQGKSGLARLKQHLDGICYNTSAWNMLSRYLFMRSRYLRLLLLDTSASGQQRRLAIFQFLQFAHEQGLKMFEGSGDPKRAFLEYVRRLEIFGEDRQLRQFPAWATHLDAVRLLTIHASKGLEFAAVYLPGLNRGTFPASRQWQPCPPPVGMLACGEQDEYGEEEECLFFVALSRARDALCLSHARRTRDRNSTPSELLTLVESCLPTPVNYVCPLDEHTEERDVAPVKPVPDILPTFDVEPLEQYLRCPRQYYYQHVLKLRGRHLDSGYVQFHRCVYDVLSWLQDQRAQGQLVDEEDAHAQLAVLWEEKGPRDHPYEAMYRDQAALLVVRAVRWTTVSAFRRSREPWEIPLLYGRVRFTPDMIELTDHDANALVVVRRMRTGRVGSSEREKNIYALYHRGADLVFPTAQRKIQVISLSGERIEDISLKQRTVETRLNRYDAAMASILCADFPARPQERECPRCPYYFICPSGEEA